MSHRASPVVRWAGMGVADASACRESAKRVGGRARRLRAPAAPGVCSVGWRRFGRAPSRRSASRLYCLIMVRLRSGLRAQLSTQGTVSGRLSQALTGVN